MARAVSGVALLMTWRGSGAGGEVWIGYQTAGPVVFAVLPAAATPTPKT
ncbi:hypothetical protein OG824_08720 [Streptomyces prunicolor]|nr:hypothetical protein [Streptomyces prunicolor]MCX5235303.1 hypothetical protein [Streptomyces prunicolor]